MFSLMNLFGAEDKSYDLLEASAERARQSAQALIHCFNEPGDGQSLGEFDERQRTEQRLQHEHSGLLCQAFFTPLEREDIEALATALHRTTKAIQALGERSLACPPACRTAGFARQAALLEQAVNLVCNMVHDLRHPTRPATFKEQSLALRSLEEKAHELTVELAGEPHSDLQEDPVTVLTLRDLSELLAKVIRRCRDVGDAAVSMAL
jgi:uncharacterized protein Yka (UPF0111/DUF47 family)